MVLERATPILHPLQIDAVSWGWKQSGGYPFRMGTGTGKNAVQAYLAKMFAEQRGAHVLLLHPNSCLVQTMEEFELWLGPEFVKHNVQLLYADDTPYAEGMTISQRAAALRKRVLPIQLLGHEAMSYKPIKDVLTQHKWDAVFLDEASRFRHWSQRTRTLLAIGKRAQWRAALSGSFVTKSPDDLWYPFQFLDRKFFPYKHETFKNEWCQLGGWQGMQPIGTRPDRRQKLASYLDEICYTLNLSDMRDDMPERPPVVLRYVPMRGQQLTAYYELADTLALEIERMSDEAYRLQVTTYISRIQRLLEIAAGFTRNAEGEVHFFPTSAKTVECVECYFNDPQPTIVWCWWRPEMQLVKDAFREAGIASVTSHDPDWRHQFKSGKVPVAILQMQAGGYGLNLDEAQRMIYHSLHWSLDNVLQSQERNWRYTTWHDKLVTHIYAANSADIDIHDAVMRNADTARPLTRADALRILRR